MEPFKIEAQDICKMTDRLLVNHVNFTAYSGEIHAIIGSNGEGKTIFAKVLAGICKKSSGSVLINSQKKNITDIASAHTAGIYMIPQELLIFPTLTVRENIICGNEKFVQPHHLWAPSRKEIDRFCQPYLDLFQLDVDLNAPISSLPTNEKRLIQLIRVLVCQPKVLILDEFSTHLNSEEVERVFRVLTDLKQQNVAIIDITHNYSILLRYCDRVSIINDGSIVASYERTEFEAEGFRRHIASLHMDFQYPTLRLNPGSELLRFTHVCGGTLKNLNFTLHKGEILGVASSTKLAGNQLVQILMDKLKISAGAVTHPADCPPSYSFIPEGDAQNMLYASQSLSFNVTASNFARTKKGGLIYAKKTEAYGKAYIDKLGIRGTTLHTKIRHMSSGAKQKLVIARSLFNQANIYIYNEPTKNLDAASRLELYNILNALILEGAAVLLISSDFGELIGMCSRIILLKEGEQVGNYSTNYLSVDALYKELQ